MKRFTKRYNNGTTTIDAEGFIEHQEAIDSVVRNCHPVEKAIKKLSIYEDFFTDKGLTDRLSWILDVEVETDEDMMKAVLQLVETTYRNLKSRLG